MKTTREDLIMSKLSKVSNFGRLVQGKTFTQSNKNDMARAVIFEINWRKFMDFASKTKGAINWTTEEEDLGIKLLDFLIEVSESSSETWDLFWQGKQPLHPKKMPFNTDGKKKVSYIDLTKVQSITIPSMGFITNN